MTRLQKNINLIFIFLFTAYTAYTIFFQQAGLFFLIYLFWFDEVIRNLSLAIQTRIIRKSLKGEEHLVNEKNYGSIKARFFFLFVYSIFIVIAFGIFAHLDKDSRDKLYENLRIIMFMHPVFNLCLCIAIVREILIIRAVRFHKFKQEPLNPMAGNMITMHLSIILGTFLWMFIYRQSGQAPTTPLNSFAMALPFLLIKLIVDLYSTNKAVHKVSAVPDIT